MASNRHPAEALSYNLLSPIPERKLGPPMAGLCYYWKHQRDKKVPSLFRTRRSRTWFICHLLVLFRDLPVQVMALRRRKALFQDLRMEYRKRHPGKAKESMRERQG